MNELQAIEFSILKDLDAFCRKHKISYFLAEGTLLGAIRHHGFIPWDDDIDVMMPRADYEKFLQIASQEIDSEAYQVQHASTVKNYWSPFIKLRLLKHSGLYSQAHIAHLTEANGPVLDIFPLDSVPHSSSLAQRFNGYYIVFLRKLLLLKLKAHKPKCVRTRLIAFLSPFYSVTGIHQRLDRAYRRFERANNQYLTNWGSYYPAHRETFHIDSLFSDEVRYAPFEGEQFPIPIRAEEVLEKIYGDYMTPPDLDSQVNKRHF